ncbi:E3 SUMO-protein ligase pli1 [Nannizzia gypsea CBS 118893]|uniref:E3 SUMO-protein ligase pli1 n=1 Tax=Arthroderma gypseum (strain ATCC MYA-4604 / CBS 118893) TaxID=535722 RepID=E4UYX8_ARTGP|nr:E3 SUMO-protein ligase pli1 [Nannizzia gypsea CBS 118893]EFR03308.1 E3 SUMO-protein ligase pli1 [Nannizzia gypsea CBS 118893]
MAPQAQNQEIQRVMGTLYKLLNTQLKAILKSENLGVSGVKQTLQARLIGRLNYYAYGEWANQSRLNSLIARIYATAQGQPSPPPLTPLSPQYPPVPQPQSSHALPPFRTAVPLPPPPSPLGRLTFKKSPFYTILEALTSVVECQVRDSSKDTVNLRVILNSETASRLLSDPNIRVMVYGAADNGLTHYSPCDIAFPHQVELKVNLDDVKANMRGLKNKPGTTRPVDITNFIRKKAGFSNSVTMTYALTQKKFFIVVNLVQKHPVEELVTQLQVRKTISAEQVIREMQARAQDADIVTTSAVMSLKCPLSTLRISVPCRTSLCTHNQCFDATSFLQLQEQAPTWSCPICYKATSFEALQVDQYVDNILRATPQSVDQVTIEQNGEWSNPNDPPEDLPGSNGIENGDDYDDELDLVEVDSCGVPTLKREFDSQASVYRTTPTPSREASSVASAPRPSTGKRTISQVIDLTGSDDEEEPPRPAKRLAFHLSNGNHHQPFDPLRLSASTSSNSPVPGSYHYHR